LQTIPGWIVNKPEGAFYFLPQVNFYFGKSFEGMVIQNSDDLALYLLNYAHTALVSGSAFGAPDCLRISYSLSQEKLKLAIQRIKDALAKLT
ncbi:MAG: aminotransferase class I/II-fold pyridoxal phosphate-dependent enzyme, partial [Saprospiraceae bacterium]